MHIFLLSVNSLPFQKLKVADPNGKVLRESLAKWLTGWEVTDLLKVTCSVLFLFKTSIFS